VLGPKKLPEVARSMGKGIREFKGALTMDTDDDEDRRRDRDTDEPAHGPAS
jgi:Sec-independent protein translocase protein TatA